MLKKVPTGLLKEGAQVLLMKRSFYVAIVVIAVSRSVVSFKARAFLARKTPPQRLPMDANWTSPAWLGVRLALSSGCWVIAENKRTLHRIP